MRKKIIVLLIALVLVSPFTAMSLDAKTKSSSGGSYPSTKNSVTTTPKSNNDSSTNGSTNNDSSTNNSTSSSSSRMYRSNRAYSSNWLLWFLLMDDDADNDGIDNDVDTDDDNDGILDTEDTDTYYPVSFFKIMLWMSIIGLIVSFFIRRRRR